MIKLEGVSLDIYGSSRRILNSIDWHIEDGECWVLFGRNGSGKTKLLEIITGYIFPSEGNVSRFGCGQYGSDIRELRRRIGYISSVVRDMFSSNERVIDAVVSGLYASIGLYRKPALADLDKAAELIKKTGLAGREYDVISHLSDGEKQKILMLRALINDPDLLILDEPATGLDIVAREEFLESLDDITKEREHSVIYVTHHVEEITLLFNKIFIIDEGECFYKGEIEEALNSDIFTSLFGRGIEVFRRGERLYSSLK
ncbi:MAG TPA: ATP-binding cassette domain-containing protein [Spirochaetota bacterium]|nr:ATP-binding cassette domain-containing protein [Spirochaetota bacterium]HPJ35828.1 ATP-binding cassette domain-containing protein [Spirochaetota bacterium]